jgi:hypothetical protein
MPRRGHLLGWEREGGREGGREKGGGGQMNEREERGTKEKGGGGEEGRNGRGT